MTLGVPAASPFGSVHVSVDLETTGLDQDRDTIIEVGAVKFQGGQVIDTFQTLVNPGRNIPEFVQRLTGIKPSQVSRAPFFNTIAGELGDFLENHPVIGHNVKFDLGFLASHGLQLQNPAYDTWDLASTLLPHAQQYSLAYLSDYFKVELRNHHRALADASATHQVFVELLRRAEQLDPGLLAHLVHLSLRSRWSIAPLLSGLQGSLPQGTAGAGLTGLDTEALAARLGPAGEAAGRQFQSRPGRGQDYRPAGSAGPLRPQLLRVRTQAGARGDAIRGYSRHLPQPAPGGGRGAPAWASR